MYSVTVEAAFSALHQLRLADGSLEPLHGHDWRVEAECRATDLDATGMVVDFDALRAALRDAVRTLHYANLNTHPLLEGRNPTAEVVAERLFHALHRAGFASLHAVKVTEAPGCTARFQAPA